MLKEFVEKIVSLGGTKTFEVNGEVFADGEFKQVRPALDIQERKELTSLDALVKMIRHEAVADLDQYPIFVAVNSYNEVNCFTKPYAQLRNQRVWLYEAHATDVPGMDSSTKYGFEQAQIALQTRFQETADRGYLLRLCSQITCGGKVTYNDNGVATTIVTQKGVALQGNETIKPLVELRPYRTFQEVEQPESLFLIRIDERGISFTEADGGMWKLKARETVKAFLEEKLSDAISEGKVVVTL